VAEGALCPSLRRPRERPDTGDIDSFKRELIRTTTRISTVPFRKTRGVVWCVFFLGSFMYFPILLVDMIHDSNESENLVDIIMDIMVDFRCLLYMRLCLYTRAYTRRPPRAAQREERRDVHLAPCLGEKKGGSEGGARRPECSASASMLKQQAPRSNVAYIFGIWCI
jgi:hypothetical protein